MKATGIVRRIDDLGRVVIPKEIRRTMRIREGDPLEIYTDREGEVIFKKYSPIGELTAFASQYAETIYKTCQLAVVICDRDAVIACAGIPKKEYTDRKLSAEIEQIMEKRSFFTCSDDDSPSVIDGGEGKISCAMPIIAEGDVAGLVASVFVKDKDSTIAADVEAKLIQTAAGFLGRQLES
ncbi:MAG: AbrB/MazE/SpoVT family DNA-binding domain-containing protein [Ruminococcaceae bacterium]|nr:AbrB/MazE/SpoVT family DNA-binding domain-containing protein [Oscillospiraceae bacterium]